MDHRDALSPLLPEHGSSAYHCIFIAPPPPPKKKKKHACFISNIRKQNASTFVPFLKVAYGKNSLLIVGTFCQKAIKAS